MNEPLRVYALTPLGALVGMFIAGVLFAIPIVLTLAVDGPAFWRAAVVLWPAWLVCVVAWSLMRLLQHRSGARRLAALALLAALACAGVVGLGNWDMNRVAAAEAQATTAAQAEEADVVLNGAEYDIHVAACVFAPGASAGALGLLMIAGSVRRRRSEGKASMA